MMQKPGALRSCLQYEVRSNRYGVRVSVQLELESHSTRSTCPGRCQYGFLFSIPRGVNVDSDRPLREQRRGTRISSRLCTILAPPFQFTVNQHTGTEYGVIGTSYYVLRTSYWIHHSSVCISTLSWLPTPHCPLSSSADSMAFSSPRALLRVSFHSLSGMLSATMPAPACT